MAESVARQALRSAAIEEADSVGVFYRLPRRKTTVIFNLKEEKDFKMDQEPPFVQAVCGIVGPPHSGRKHLGERFGKMDEEVLEKVCNDKQLCYCGNFDTSYQGRSIQAVIKAYIIPPPYSESKKPLYMRAASQFCCLLFAYDVTKRSSFNALEECIRKMNMFMPRKFFVVGNKCDLRGTVPKEIEVPEDMARDRAAKMGAYGYFECSAKRNINVKEIMDAIVICECEQPHL